uniref:Placental growth factor b n=1 Tax=Scophthalmus maximus TaxID=52904 RepID=A0A8D3E333_SCOMX
MIPISAHIPLSTYIPNWATLNFLFSSTVIMFQEVWSRSFCRTIEKLVEVVQEYPTEVEHIYSPSCVPLVRCAGCCGDENLECHPTHTTNVTMELLKIRPSEPGQEYVEMTFVEHQTCECPSKVTAAVTQPPVAAWLIIYFQPSDGIKSLLRSSINTVCQRLKNLGCFADMPSYWWAEHM